MFKLMIYVNSYVKLIFYLKIIKKSNINQILKLSSIFKFICDYTYIYLYSLYNVT